MASNLYKIYVTSNNEWRELELDDLNLSTVFSVEEISDISQRKDNITKTITLKGTKQNNKVLGALYALDRDVASDAINPENLMHNYKPNKYIDCFVLENNVEIIRGKLLVTSVEVERGVIYYNASIVGTVYSFFSQLTDRKLEELDSFDVAPYNNLLFNVQNIKDSWRMPRLEGGLNIINRRALNTGGVVWTDGEITTTQAYASYNSYSDFIRIKPNTDYTLRKSTNPESDKYIRLAFYDSGFSMINRLTSLAVEIDFNVLSPANAVYVRLSFPTSVSNIKMEEGLVFTGYSDNPEDKLDFVYPMIDYGGGGFLTEEDGWDVTYPYWRWDVYRPAIYVRSYLDALFRGFRLNSERGFTQKNEDGSLLSNYRWEGSIKNDADFNKLIIPHNEARLNKEIVDPTLREDGVVLEATLSGSTDINSRDSNGYRPVTGYSNTIANGTYATSDMILLNGKLHRVINIPTEYEGTITVSGAIQLTGSLPFGSKTIKVALFHLASGSATSFNASNIVAERTLHITGSMTGAYYNLNYSGELSGRYVIASIGLESTMAFASWDYVDNALTVKADLDSPLYYGDRYKLFNLIPKNVDAKSFLKNIMLMFNLYLVVDKEDDTLFHMYTYNEFYRDVLQLDIDKALDWSDKVDWRSYSINSNIDLPRSYEYRYKDDSDVINQTYKREVNEIYGEYKLLDSGGLIDSKKVEVMFSPTINFKWKQNIDLPVIYEGDQLLSGERKQFKSNLRILYFNGEVTMGIDSGDNLLTYSLMDDEGYEIPATYEAFTSYGHTSMVSRDTIKSGGIASLVGEPRETLFFDVPAQFWNDDAGFFTSNDPLFKETMFLFHKYHQKQILELTDVNLMTVDAKVYLNESDISGLDFRNPIYLQSPYGSAYFKLLKVEYSDSNTESKVTLQKVVLPDTNIK